MGNEDYSLGGILLGKVSSLDILCNHVADELNISQLCFVFLPVEAGQPPALGFAASVSQSDSVHRMSCGTWGGLSSLARILEKLNLHPQGNRLVATLKPQRIQILTLPKRFLGSFAWEHWLLSVDVVSVCL